MPLNRPATVVPLIGARNATQLTDNLGALDVSLDSNQMNRLDEVSEIELGFPHDFLASDHVQDIVFGGTQDKIDR